MKFPHRYYSFMHIYFVSLIFNIYMAPKIVSKTYRQVKYHRFGQTKRKYYFFEYYVTV